ncbi:TonB-dependent receptor [Nitratireductor soli]|uniref:TonB-dependent receptor n=1 Tax=Nitratireductor soli TaxID=1670619 RepID=UPI000A9A6F49|nr:TonB-dependent receptor [Nitratireductor soli]
MKRSRTRFLLATSALSFAVAMYADSGVAADLRGGVEPIPEPPVFVPEPRPARAAIFDNQPVYKGGDELPIYMGDDLPPLLEMGGACEGAACPAMVRGKVLDNSQTSPLRIGENTEQAMGGDRPSLPFMISVDGQVVDESGAIRNEGAFGVGADARPVDRQRKTDVDLSAVDIQVKFDGLDQEPLLNVSTMPMRRAYRPGEPVQFYATSNYPAFINRGEIRIYDNRREHSRKPVAVIPIRVNSEAGWVMPADPGGDYTYVLRVYDDRGRFDETVPLTLVGTRGEIIPDSGDAIAPGKAEDRTAFRNIPVYGGAVTVYGRNVPEGYGIVAFDELVPLDANGTFVTQRILPPGQHAVDIAVDGTSKGGGLYFSRDVNIPTSDWFYVALADFTIGKRTGDDGIEDVRSGEYDKVWQTGRLAFYLRGKIKGKFLLTAAADTGEDDIKNLFKDLDARDPKELLRRIDPDKYYPVYGDDSKSVDDAPTSGKFYVRLERGDSHVMWGNYKTKISGTRFLQVDRGLYGASAVLRSPGNTSFGDPRFQATGFAAQPETLPQRDEFLGTGGSAYFLKRQKVITGSETLHIEYRDKVTGRLIERRALAYGEDYNIDYLQGVVILDKPVSQATAERGPVRDGALGGYTTYIVAQYEYRARLGEADDYVFGGRAERWLKDSLRVGVTGMADNTGSADQRVYGADVRIRRSDTTYIDGEIAYSKGPGFGTSRSTDGGLTISDTPTAGRPDTKATAWSLRGQMDLKDFKQFGIPGTIGGYYESKDAGFSSVTEQITIDERLWGAHANLPLTTTMDLDVSYDDYSNGEGRRRSETEASVSWEFDAYWKAAFGVSYSKLYAPGSVASGKSGYDGTRLDAGVRIDYKQDEDTGYYGFAQTTVDRKGGIKKNDRYGVGAEMQITEKIGAEGEISWGPSGIGGLAGLTYSPTAEDKYYVGYRLDPDRANDGNYGYDLVGADRGAIVAGVKKRINDVTSAYSETNYDLFGRRRALAQTYGVVYTPDPVWTVDAGFEAGSVEDSRINAKTGKEYSDFERYAGSLSLGFKEDELGLSSRVRGEARLERSDDGSRNRNTYLMSAGLAWKHDESGRLLGNIDAVITDADAGTYYNGDYVEGSIGYAYRPIDNDLLNALFRYTYLRDLPGNDQISSLSRSTNGPEQRSHIVSADLTYDLLPWLSVGGKYAMRMGEIRQRKTDGSGAFGAWEESTAHLGILRTDLHIVKNWDALLEGRAFFLPDIKSTDYGALAAVYRHVGNNFKVGAGYNFGRFSDDLRDLTLDDGGPFLNVVGKF